MSERAGVEDPALDQQTEMLRRRYVDAQLAGNRREALRLVIEEGVERGLSVAEIHTRVIQPAQYEIGRRWQLNEITVAQEHVATAISQLVVSHLYHDLPRAEPNGKTVLVTCVAGEQHEMGARMASDFLEMAGFDVQFLGANVPSASLVRMIEDRTPDMLVISAATTLCFPSLRQTIADIRATAAGAVLPIAVGGNAFRWTSGCDVGPGVLDAGKTADDLVATARRVLGV